MKLDAKQQAVGRGMAAAVAATLAVAAAVGVTGWRPAGSGDRLAYAAACLQPPVLCLAAAIARSAAGRFFSPQDIDAAAGGPDTRRMLIAQAILRNTLEQLALATPVYLGAAAWLPERFQGWVAAASALFVAGRVLFWRNYARGAGARAFGFGLTFYPSVALALAVFASLA